MNQSIDQLAEETGATYIAWNDARLFLEIIAMKVPMC